MGLPFYKENVFFDAVMAHVSYSAFVRLKKWESGWIQENGLNCLTAKYYRDRHDWMLSDPDWSVAVMVVKLAREED